MNTFNIELPLTNDHFRNKIPDVWVGDELATLLEAEMTESCDGDFYAYTLKAKYATDKDAKECVVFAVDSLFRPDAPVNIDRYVS